MNDCADLACSATCPRLSRLLWRTALVFIPALLISVTVMNYLQGNGSTWAGGGHVFSDLTQHYVAGRLWREGQRREIYRDFQLGDAINQWSRETLPDNSPSNGIKNFNYVYSPLVLWLAAQAADLSYSTWCALWLTVLGASWLGALFLLLRALPEAFRTDFDTIMLYLGFPSFYLALIPGQNTPVTLLIGASAILLMRRGAPMLAGLVMACAFYKPQLMPGLFLFMAARGEFRFCLGLALGNMLWLVLGLLSGGTQTHLWWLQSLRDMNQGMQFIKPGMNQSWSAWLPPGSLWSSLPALFLPLAAGFWSRRLPLQAAPALACALAVTLTASPYLGYYELLLGLPWWWWHWRREGGMVRAFLFWVSAWLAMAGLFLKTPLAAPPLLIWLIWTLTPQTGHQGLDCPPDGHNRNMPA